MSRLLTKLAKIAVLMVILAAIVIISREAFYRYEENQLFQRLNSAIQDPQMREALARNYENILRGKDADLRVRFVGSQADIEAAAIRYGKVGFQATHTALPSSPLCQTPPSAMNPEIASDPARVATVSRRTQTMEDILRTGAPVFSIYSKSGKSKRTAAEQESYQAFCNKYPNLFDRELTTDVPAELSGATLFIQTSNSSLAGVLMFIYTTQVQQDPNNKQWEFVLSPLSKLPSHARKKYDQVKPMLQAAGAELPPEPKFGIRNWRLRW